MLIPRSPWLSQQSYRCSQRVLLPAVVITRASVADDESMSRRRGHGRHILATVFGLRLIGTALNVAFCVVLFTTYAQSDSRLLRCILVACSYYRYPLDFTPAGVLLAVQSGSGTLVATGGVAVIANPLATPTTIVGLPSGIDLATTTPGDPSNRSTVGSTTVHSEDEQGPPASCLPYVACLCGVGFHAVNVTDHDGCQHCRCDGDVVLPTSTPLPSLPSSSLSFAPGTVTSTATLPTSSIDPVRKLFCVQEATAVETDFVFLLDGYECHIKRAQRFWCVRFCTSATSVLIML